MLRILRKFKENLKKTAFSSRLAVSVLTLFLLLFNLTLWSLSARLIRLQETSNRQTLETSIELISRAINPRDLFFLQVSYDPLLESTDFDRMAIYANSPSVISLVESFKASGAAEQKSLSSRAAVVTGGKYEIALITPDGYLALDGKQLYTEPVLPTYYDDGKTLERARSGEQALSGWTNLNLEPHTVRVRHAYYPLFTESEQPGEAERVPLAILQLEYREPVTRFATLLPRRLTQLGILSTLLVLSLWVFLNHLISRSLRFRQAAEQTDRLRALGNLTAGVAHEIRNPLGIILLTLEEIRSVSQGLSDEQRRAEIVELTNDIQEETKRLEGLTEQFLSFTRGHVSKKKSPHAALSPLAELTEPTIKLFCKSLGPETQLSFDCQLTKDDVCAVEPHEWRQILLNILQNAAQAIVPTHEGKISVQQFRTKNLLVTTIEDNGKGMDKQTLAKVFDPFFTTKDQGTGLGLSISKTLMENAGGELLISTELGKGTKITLQLPEAKR